MKNRKIKFSTDYFFESLYLKVKAFLFSDWISRLATLKVLAIVAWFKEIN
jgi:hypothetical protein